MLRRSIIAIVLMGCGGARQMPPAHAAAGQQETGNRKQETGNGERETETETEREKQATGDRQQATGNAAAETQPAPPPPPPPALDVPTTYVAAKGKRVRFELHAIKSVGRGVRIAFANVNHKHLADGGATAMYDFTLMRGKHHESVVLSTDDDELEAELDALGVLVVVTGSSFKLELTVVGKTPAPLEEDAAAEKVVEAAERERLPVGDASYSIENGVMSYVSSENGVPRWRARVGVYTRRVWFLPP